MLLPRRAAGMPLEKARFPVAPLRQKEMQIFAAIGMQFREKEKGPVKEKGPIS